MVRRGSDARDVENSSPWRTRPPACRRERLAPPLHAISRMHFGAAIRDVLSVSCSADLRHAKAHTVLPELHSPRTRRLLAANLELAFGVTVPDEELERLTTVRDVLQCVRLRRWAKRVESDAQSPPTDAATAAAAMTPAIVAARREEPRQEVFRFTRRSAATPTAPLFDRPPAASGLKRL
jgi:hypothetical protein